MSGLDRLYADSLQGPAEVRQLVVTVQLSPVEETAGPGENGRCGARRQVRGRLGSHGVSLYHRGGRGGV